MARVVKCSQCERKREVSEDWTFRLCPICRHKNLEKKSLEKCAKEARQGLNVKKCPIIKSYSYFKKHFLKKIPNVEPTFEEYLKICESYRSKERRLREKASLADMRKERQENKLINSGQFPLGSEDCRTYRLLRAKDQRSIKENEWMAGHILPCKSCTEWLERFKLYQDMQDLGEGDMSPFDKPNEGANPYESSNQIEEDSDHKLLDRDLERSEFD